jgi:hypothetical protein
VIGTGGLTGPGVGDGGDVGSSRPLQPAPRTAATSRAMVRLIRHSYLSKRFRSADRTDKNKNRSLLLESINRGEWTGVARFPTARVRYPRLASATLGRFRKA